jgi:hypothetical protein
MEINSRECERQDDSTRGTLGGLTLKRMDNVASPRNILGRLMGQTLRLAGTGLGVGAFVALAVSRMLTSPLACAYQLRDGVDVAAYSARGVVLGDGTTRPSYDVILRSVGRPVTLTAREQGTLR